MEDILASPASRSFISQRLRLHYVDWGNPDAPPLLLVHGGRDHCRNWDWLAEELRHDWHIIAPDLRGHGDSAHSLEGNYALDALVYDLAQLVHQLGLAQVNIVGHSLGGNVAVRFTGIYPDKVRRLVAIEGLRPLETDAAPAMDERLRNWIETKRAVSSRQPRRYPSIEDALARMMAENQHLSPERARHLTVHGVNQNEDGTYSWKFDNYMHAWSPVDLSQDDLHAIWHRITCPTLLVYGAQSWAANPAEDGRATIFRNARVSLYENAGHWVHHDRHNAFVEEVRAFLR